MKKIGFIGCGNMGGALAAAAVKSVGGENVFVCDSDNKKAQLFSDKYKANCADTKTVCEESDYIFLGVKPQMLSGLFSEIKPYLEAKSRVVLVSMAAGVNIASLEKVAPKGMPIIRIMPNMPASVGSGIILYAPNAFVKDDEVDEFCSAMKEAGMLDKIDEAKIDAASCISGCGPAFVFMFIEALSDGAVECGLPREKALLYAAEVLKGSAELMLKTGEHPGKLKDSVCSPAGSTIEGVKALEDGSFRADAINAVIAAYRRTLELGK